MARERISLIQEDLKEAQELKRKVQSGEINKENFHELSPDNKKEVNKILFEIAESKITLSQGLSTVEFILFAHMRIMNKKIKGLSLSADELKIEEELESILNMHEITDPNVFKKDWLIEYLNYAEKTSMKVLQNREEHVKRKREVTGK